MSKRTLHAFFKPSSSSPQAKKSRTDTTSTGEIIPTSQKQEDDPAVPPSSIHPTYPFPIAALDSSLSTSLSLDTPSNPPKHINNQPHLDLLYFQPYIPHRTAQQLFLFLRRNLPFYRVKYTIRRGSTETIINTPRFTTVFGVDETSYFALPADVSNTNKNTDADTHDDTNTNTTERILIDRKTKTPISKTKYKCTPRPIPSCLETVREQIESVCGATFNFCLINYYASGEDSISYHSDDERFLGPEPTIASLSLGAKRDFLMKHKPFQSGGERDTLKLPLGSGDMVVMRGETQANWLHSIPKRKAGGEADRGRINITFRKAVVPGGTENYYRYNVGDGEVYRWDEEKGEMVKWKG
ncbi:hypothetical protein DTO195F2_8982 [Paecilomyces variotii]|nr:hypothetical protein DTO195F2_8982 [Paecilomyces variotii]KAJ9367585.1 hypothetical protein DTO282E5_7723 [Paecilomyces variotii]